MTGRRLRIAGLHHVTLLCKDVERSVGFYRNLLGMRVVKQVGTLTERQRLALAAVLTAKNAPAGSEAAAQPADAQRMPATPVGSLAPRERALTAA